MLDQPIPNPVAKNPNLYTHKVFAAVGLILIGTIIAVAGIWYFSSSNSSSENDPTTTKVSTSSARKATETAKDDETEAWLTYSNLKYSLKYPPAYQYSETSDKTYVSFGKEKVDGQVVNTEFSTSISNESANYASIISKEINKSTETVPNEVQGKNIVIRLSDTTVDGYHAVRETIEPTKESPNTFQYQVIVTRGGNYYEITTTADTKEVFDLQRKTLDLILSTFKFF